ncbi:MAG: hypothetical protein ABIO06_09685 [Pseudolysinimonas sp.]
MNSDIPSIAQSIEKNPLGRLMYGQRELFHSNLLAWFFDTLPEAADRVFSPMSDPGIGSEERRVQRELGNLDLVMRWPGRRPLVLENKVFSIPTFRQLDEYAQKTSRWIEEPMKALLAPSKPPFELDGWAFVSYRDLASSISESLSGPDTSYETETMRRYASLASDLSELVGAVEVGSYEELVWLPETLLDSVSSGQMLAALQKARASRVAWLINKEVPGLNRPAGSGMTRAKPFVESFEAVEIDGIRVLLGWQLQGHDLRRSAIYQDESLRGRQVQEGISREHPEFFTLPSSYSDTRAGRSEFNYFAPDSVYQYVKVKNLTIQELIAVAQWIHDDLSKLGVG